MSYCQKHDNFDSTCPECFPPLPGFVAQRFTVVPRTFYERNEDMSPDGKLRLIVQDDGDIIVAMNGRTMNDAPCIAQLEFCSVGSGGGRSPHTREALRNLIVAIQRDNQEQPIA